MDRVRIDSIESKPKKLNSMYILDHNPIDILSPHEHNKKPKNSQEYANKIIRLQIQIKILTNNPWSIIKRCCSFNRIYHILWTQ